MKGFFEELYAEVIKMMQWDFTIEHQLEMEREEVREEERLRAIRNMIELEVEEDKILTKYTKEEYEKAQASRIAIR